MKISKISLSPLDFEKFEFPPDFAEFKNPVPPLHKWVKGEAAMDTYLTQEYTI